MLSTKKNPSLIINSLSNMVSLGVHILVVFTLTPKIIKHLGTTQYGIWAIVISIVGYYGLLEFGLKSTITRFVALDRGKKDYESINKTISTAFYFFSLIGLSLIIISFLCAEPISGLFKKIPQENEKAFIHLIWILGISTGLTFPTNILHSNLMAHEKFVAYNISQVIVILIRFFGTLFAISNEMGLLGVAGAYSISYAFNFILNLILFLKLTPDIKIGIKYFKIEKLKTILGFGLKTSIMQIANQIRFNLDSLVIAQILTIPLVGVYRVASLIIRYLLSMTMSISSTLIPRFSNLAGKKELSPIDIYKLLLP